MVFVFYIQYFVFLKLNLPNPLIQILIQWKHVMNILCLHTFSKFIMELHLVMDRVPKIGFSGTRNQPKNGFKRQVKQGYSSFSSKFFGIFDDFSKFYSIFGTLYFESSNKYGKNSAKNEEKPCSTCPLNGKPISPWHHSQNP